MLFPITSISTAHSTWPGLIPNTFLDPVSCRNASVPLISILQGHSYEEWGRIIPMSCQRGLLYSSTRQWQVMPSIDQFSMSHLRYEQHSALNPTTVGTLSRAAPTWSRTDHILCYVTRVFRQCQGVSLLTLLITVDMLISKMECAYEYVWHDMLVLWVSSIYVVVFWVFSILCCLLIRWPPSDLLSVYLIFLSTACPSCLNTCLRDAFSQAELHRVKL